jgi:hypothetical protein
MPPLFHTLNVSITTEAFNVSQNEFFYSVLTSDLRPVSMCHNCFHLAIIFKSVTFQDFTAVLETNCSALDHGSMMLCSSVLLLQNYAHFLTNRSQTLGSLTHVCCNAVCINISLMTIISWQVLCIGMYWAVRPAAGYYCDYCSATGVSDRQSTTTTTTQTENVKHFQWCAVSECTVWMHSELVVVAARHMRENLAPVHHIPGKEHIWTVLFTEFTPLAPKRDYR